MGREKFGPTISQEELGIPSKVSSRNPYMLMLLDDSGEVKPVKLNPDQVNSDNAVIVLDEYSDTCWVFVGRNVNMPTRMHALRIGKSVQKAGYKIGITTIGMASSNIVEMLEKDDSDPEVATAIGRFKEAIGRRWTFEDQFLALDSSLAKKTTDEPIAGAPPPRPPVDDTPTVTATTVAEKPTPPPKPPATSSLSDVEKSMASLLYAAVKNSDLVYTERFERDGKMGLKIESPGVMVIEAIQDGNRLKIDPPEFGDSEGAARIKADYESWF
ncbi:MAG: hypothetical protein ACFFAY_10205 [Promethearchaeota archaeon]